MGIKLTLEVEAPLSDDDRDLLAGISVMTLATANRQNLAVGQAGADPLEDGSAECGRVDDGGRVCDREVSHPGRHRFCPLELSLTGNGLKD